MSNDSTNPADRTKDDNTKETCAHCWNGLNEFQFSLADRPKTARDFKKAIHQQAMRAVDNATALFAFVNDIAFLNETTLELLDGIQPLADKKQELTRVLIRKLQDRMFKRNDEGMTLTVAADRFQDEFRERFFQDVERDTRRWDRGPENVIALLTKSVARNLEGEEPKNALVALVKILTRDSKPDDKAIGDELIGELYYQSEAMNEIGMVGFLAASDALLASLSSVCGVEAGNDNEQAGDNEQSDADFFETNQELVLP